jgi:general secretion pathway protein B
MSRACEPNRNSMSYILDALRKADAQRERDPARGIHAQPVRMAIGEPRLPGGYRIGVWAASAAGLAVLASAAWYLLRDGGSTRRVPPAPVEVVAAPAPAVVAPPVTPPAAAVLPPPVVVAPPMTAPPPIVVAPPVVGVPAAGRPAESPGAALARAGQPARNPPMDTAAPVPVPPVAGVPATAPAAAVAEATAPGLPADAPKLAISGGVYSASAAQRMLIVNGQVFNEGGEIGPGVVLEEIRPKAAVLRFRGTRYTVAY